MRWIRARFRVFTTRRFFAVLVLLAQTLTAAGLPVSTRPTGCGCQHAGGELANCCCGPGRCQIPQPTPPPPEQPPPSCCSVAEDDQITGCASCGTTGPDCCCSGKSKPKPQPRSPFAPWLTADDCQGRPGSPPGFLTPEPGLPFSVSEPVPFTPACSHTAPVQSDAALCLNSRPPTPPPRSI